ncbi:cyclophilin-like fold protein [Angustibacter speluncae]
MVAVRFVSVLDRPGDFGGTLDEDDPVAAAVAARLPLRLSLRDHGGVEKLSVLDPPLVVPGAQRSDSPGPGDIGYYAPGRCLVLYHGHVGSWPGLYRVGRFDLDPSLLAQVEDGTVLDLTHGRS